MFTIVASSTTMSWARATVPRISHRRGSGGALARTARGTVVDAEFMASSKDVAPRSRGAGKGGDAAAGGVGVGVVEHVAGPLTGQDGQHESGGGAGIAHGDPGPVVDRRPPQADLNVAAPIPRARQRVVDLWGENTTGGVAGDHQQAVEAGVDKALVPRVTTGCGRWWPAARGGSGS